MNTQHPQTRRQCGQSMVEYVVILAALSAALLLPGLGSVGLTQNDADSLLRAAANKHRGHGYALSLSEIPETDDMIALADYYDSLNKYPELSPQLRNAGTTLGNLQNDIDNIANGLSNFNPSQFLNPFSGVNVTPNISIFNGNVP